MSRQALKRCSFCGKTQKEVAHLITNNDGAFICCECVAACRGLLVGAGWWYKGVLVFCPHCGEEAVVASREAAADWSRGHLLRCEKGPVAEMRAEIASLKAKLKEAQ